MCSSDLLGEPLPTTVEITARRPMPGEVDDLAGTGANWLARHFYFLMPDTFALVAQVQLTDGSHAVFFARVPQEPLRRYESLIPRLLLTLLIFFALATLAAATTSMSAMTSADVMHHAHVAPMTKGSRKVR